MSSEVCRPSPPHSSSSTPGQDHVDYQHFEVHENGTERYVGPCEGNQHVTGGIVEAVRSFFGGGKSEGGSKDPGHMMGG